MSIIELSKRRYVCDASGYCYYRRNSTYWWIVFVVVIPILVFAMVLMLLRRRNLRRSRQGQSYIPYTGWTTYGNNNQAQTMPTYQQDYQQGYQQQPYQNGYSTYTYTTSPQQPAYNNAQQQGYYYDPNTKPAEETEEQLPPYKQNTTSTTETATNEYSTYSRPAGAPPTHNQVTGANTIQPPQNSYQRT